MQKRLENKIAVVTGAGRGVGEAYALALAAEGARVVVNDFDGALANAVVERIRALGGIAVPNTNDVAVFERAGSLIEQTLDTFGRLDILIANAGIIRPAWLHEISEKDWLDTFAVHVHGTFNCYRHAAPRMIDQRTGSIVMTGAGSGEGAPERVGATRRAHPRLGSYRASKAAIMVMTLHAAAELQPFGINVNAIMPGATATTMQRTYYTNLKDSGVAAEPVDMGWPEASLPETVPALGVYLCTAAGSHITGRAFQLNGNQIMVAAAGTTTSSIVAPADRWTVDALIDKAPAWLAG